MCHEAASPIWAVGIAKAANGGMKIWSRSMRYGHRRAPSTIGILSAHERIGMGDAFAMRVPPRSGPVHSHRPGSLNTVNARANIDQALVAIVVVIIGARRCLLPENDSGDRARPCEPGHRPRAIGVGAPQAAGIAAGLCSRPQREHIHARYVMDEKFSGAYGGAIMVPRHAPGPAPASWRR